MGKRTTRCEKNEEVSLLAGHRLILEVQKPADTCDVTITDDDSPGCDPGYVVLGACQVTCSHAVTVKLRLRNVGKPAKVVVYSNRQPAGAAASAVPGWWPVHGPVKIGPNDPLIVGAVLAPV